MITQHLIEETNAPVFAMPETKQPTAKPSKASVERLRRSPDSRARAETAASVGSAFSEGGMNERERRLAVEIIEQLAVDVERQVREALCEHVMHCPFLPKSVAQTLANDVESVALPVIRNSHVLNDDDLIAIVHEGSHAKQIAVAERKQVTPEVSSALVHTRKREVVGTLIANQGAEIADTSFDILVDQFGQDDRIQALLVERQTLPLRVTERLMTQVSAALRDQLIERHCFPPVIADELIMHGHERALAQVMNPGARATDIESLAKELHGEDALTPTLLLRTLCSGDLAFFVASIAVLAGIPRLNAQILIDDTGQDGFLRLYNQAGLPADLYDAFRSALMVVRDVRHNEPHGWAEEYTRRIIDSLVLTYNMLCPADLENVLAQLSRQLKELTGPAYANRQPRHAIAVQA